MAFVANIAVMWYLFCKVDRDMKKIKEVQVIIPQKIKNNQSRKKES